MDVNGRTVVVTGASQGIGEAFARAFAAAGANVVVAARNVERLDGIAAEIGGSSHPVDLLDPVSVDSFVTDVERAHGPIDVLVNNAGIETEQPAATVDPNRIRDLCRLNLEAPMMLTRHVLPGMIERRRGHLVFMSSLAGAASFPGMSHYCGTKAGLTNFASTVRWEVRKHGIGVTIAAAGPVDTEMWDRIEDSTGAVAGIRRRLGHLQLLPKAQPEAIATAMVDAVRTGKRHVRTPKRLSAVYWINEAPRRIVEASLTGVRFDPLDR